MEEIRLYFDNLIEIKKKDYFNKQDEKVLISLNYNENDKYHLFLTTKRSLIIKEKLKKVKNIVIDNINIKVDDINFKNQSSSTKINFSNLEELSNSIIILSEKLKPMIRKSILIL